MLEEILCILRSDPTSAESDQLDLLCCQPEPFADASTPLSGSFSVSTHWRLSARSGALICMHEITWQVRLQFHAEAVTGRIPNILRRMESGLRTCQRCECKVLGRTRGVQRSAVAARRRGARICWAEARVKITRMTLTIKLDRNWSSFQLANSAPPLSVTGSAIAPSARMLGGGSLLGADLAPDYALSPRCTSRSLCRFAMYRCAPNARRNL